MNLLKGFGLIAIIVLTQSTLGYDQKTVDFVKTYKRLPGKQGRHDKFQLDLTKANLANIDLTNANLKGAHLSQAILVGTNLEGANLEGADLEGAFLLGANLEKANLKNTNLAKTYFMDGYTQLYKANISRANFLGSKKIRLEKPQFLKIFFGVSNLSELINLKNSAEKEKIAASMSRLSTDEGELDDSKLEEFIMLKFSDEQSLAELNPTPVTKSWLRGQNTLNVETAKTDQ